MWYFAWILGVLLACAFGIINVLWLEAQESLEQDAVVLDPVTRTLIRFEFLAILKEKVNRYQFERHPFCLLMMGLNDLSGRPVKADSDKSIRTLLDYTEIIRGILPKQKTLLARYDACTFAAVLSNTGIQGAESLAEQICGISAARGVAPSEDTVISIGITECRRRLLRECGKDLTLALNTLLQNADQAMREARSQGNNRHVTVIRGPR
jgi:cytochrome bd-I ubiquinol oxidase subunit X